MKTKVLQKGSVVVATIIFCSLAACSSGSKKPEYYDAVETPSLDIPEGLSQPQSGSALVIRAPYMPPPSMILKDTPPRISSTTSGLDSNSRLSWSAQGLYLLVEDTEESTYRRLGFVLERGGMQRIRVDENGVYRFDYYQKFEEEGGFFSKMAFWSRDKSEDYSGAYQAFTQPEGENTRVYLKYADGTDCEPDAAEHLLAVLSERMG
ncbi:MAG: outer membrane protein assembly factor BamC [Xanthomonadales bacterium]|nr:outer membrane protein assembly factor BamC [Gammaproteobacteria bacterium]MBT8054506.1 outer membrane protein assembly factor BamC [Gammaproteobacteria bacterium]NND56097.1 outer membrane protein assembly factor BamC [Xanthomonadales bacterium]